MIAPSCGWCLFSAIFSGRIWTSRKTAIKTGGTMMNANHAMTPATESSVSPWRNEACARDGSARNVKAMNRTKRLPRRRRHLSENRISEVLWFHGLSIQLFQPCTSSTISLSRNSSGGFVIACPAASLRSVSIRRHCSPTRRIIAAISSKTYWTFVVHARSHFQDWSVHVSWTGLRSIETQELGGNVIQMHGQLGEFKEP